MEFFKLGTQFMKSQTQEELILKEVEVVKEVVKIENKEGLKHHQEIITKVDVEIDFRNKEIKTLRNEQLNLHEELKGMEEVLHQQEEELNTE